MMEVQCPICEHRFNVVKIAREGERISCPNCFAQLGLYKIRNKYILGCAICKEPVFEPGNCGECERRHEKRKQILEEGRL